MLDFLRETDLIVFLMFILISSLIGQIIVKIFEDKWFKTERQILIFKIKAPLIIFTIILIIFYLKSPYSASLNTFYFPEDISEIEDKKRLLILLQKYNETIHKTTEMLHWFIFLFATFFSLSIYNLLKLLNLKDK